LLAANSLISEDVERFEQDYPRRPPRAAQSGNLSDFWFTGYAPGASEFSLGGGFYEITPTVVPEPSTYGAGFLALGALAYHQRRRWRCRRNCRVAAATCQIRRDISTPSNFFAFVRLDRFLMESQAQKGLINGIA
jgi:hypothetical protein